jgi:hypothetical protein
MDRIALPMAIASDIVEVINAAPEADRMVAAEEFLQVRLVLHFQIFEALGSIVVVSCLLNIFLPLFVSKQNHHET